MFLKFVSPRGFDGELKLDDLLKRDDVKGAIAKAIEEATKGLKGNNETLVGEKRTLAEQLKAIKDKVGDFDIDKAKEILARIDADEDAALIKEGKLDVVVNRRIERAIAEAKKNEIKLQKDLETEKANGSKMTGQIHRLVVETELRRVASKMGIVDTAVSDFVARGMGVFTAVEKDNAFHAFQLDQDGSPVRGKDGKTPLMPEEWAGGLRETAPHFWPPSNGGGAGGSGSGKPKNGSDMDKMSPREKLAQGMRNAAAAQS